MFRTRIMRSGAGTTYASGDNVKKGVNVYRSLIDSNTGNDPADQINNAAKWKLMGVINRMKPFDEKLSTKVRQANSIIYHLDVGRVATSVIIKGVEGAESITLRVVVDSTVIYTLTVPMFAVPTESGLWHWLYGNREDGTDANFFNLPTYTGATLEIEATGTADLAIGVIAVGSLVEYGEYVLTGSGVSINNFALGGYDDWGDPIINQLSWSKTATVDVLLRKREVDALQKMIAKARFSPSIWIGSEDYESLNIYGFVESFDIPLAWEYPEARLTIRGCQNDGAVC
ncbi:hypothetical protein [Comamonas serinivorans]|uniref:hypothetical protein n=1 Tax=Comamonas serinivorans TaxID=1082851 RepID=UPI00196A2A7A|nr:hypothetical protein [Comamonas serinivorans]